MYFSNKRTIKIYFNKNEQIKGLSRVKEGLELKKCLIFNLFLQKKKLSESQVLYYTNTGEGICVCQ